MAYFLPFIITFFLTIFFVETVRRGALKYKIIDDPKREPERKLHREPIPLSGGVAIFFAFYIVVACYAYGTHRILFPTSSILIKHLVGVFTGGVILIIGGFLDDKYNLKPSKQIIFPILAAMAVIISGISITYITNPFGGTINLAIYKIFLLRYGDFFYEISLPSDIITFFWILGMIYTTKLLDGLDGLVAGITFIGAVVIFIASLGNVYTIPQVALLAIVLAGACLGFLIFNFNPAKIFLGEGGSTLCGFLLANLAVLSQGKIAVTLLMMGIPVLDVIWVILRRLFSKSQTIKSPDRKHLHHRLLDAGFSHRGAVIFLYCVTGFFGITSLFLQSKGRFLALGVLVIVMIIIGFMVVKKYRPH